MKTLRQTFAAVSAVFCLSLTAFNAQTLELHGFRGVSWGEGAEALGPSVVAYTEGSVTCYRREGENMMFGDVSLKGVRYCFHQDRLFMVSVDAAVGHKALASEFQRTYGRPDVRTAKVVTWGKSSSTRADLLAQGASVSRLTLYSNKIEPALAQRLQKLDPADATRNVAAAY